MKSRAVLPALAFLTFLFFQGCQAPQPRSGYCNELIEPMSTAERDAYKSYLNLPKRPIAMTPSFLQATDGKKVPMSVWRPAGQPRAIVIASPGLDMACSEFEVLGRGLAPKGIAVWALDLRAQGHEQDLQQRGTRAPWDLWIQDAEQLVGELRKTHPGTPIFLTGQSTGDCVALMAASRLGPGKIAGLLLHSMPFIYLYPSAATLRDTAFISPLPPFLYRFTTAYSLSVSPYSFANFHDPHLNAWLSSPLRIGMSGPYISDCFALGRATRKDLPIVTPPVLVQLGCKDSLALSTDDPSTVVARFQHAILSQVDVLYVKQGGHLLLAEQRSRAQTLANDLTWLNYRIARYQRPR